MGSRTNGMKSLFVKNSLVFHFEKSNRIIEYLSLFEFLCTFNPVCGVDEFYDYEGKNAINLLIVIL